jgi:indolepyruvate ferredoxin oxidoreductase alpha subunit
MLGDEAVATAAIDAGVTGAYAYPGTPATEIFARMIAEAETHEGVTAHWCANEKSAMEAALGTSLAGRRALVTMKHVGLNVAMDPFVNSALLALGGGIVVAVADDPGMHSSQNEQDSRFLADFARIPVLEPATAQEAYDMTRAGFELSEAIGRPVLVRLVTRLCHERAGVARAEARPQNELKKAGPLMDWTLLPANSRRLWRGMLEQAGEIAARSEGSPFNTRTPGHGRLGVITSGIARRYYMEVAPELDEEPPHLHIGAYPLPADAIRAFTEGLDKILVVEEGYPFIESQLTSLLGGGLKVLGRSTGTIPEDGELTPGLVRLALGFDHLIDVSLPPPAVIPGRPPQLCQGCVHRDAYAAMAIALEDYGPREGYTVTGDIGCYTLGALPPHQAIDSCVCMGASVGMAKGASDAGLKPALAVIGDSTFLHSGVTPLMDAVSHDTDMTLLILDNETVAMTGGQPTVLPDSRLEPLVLGLGVDPDHVHAFNAHPKKTAELGALIKREIEHPGLSVVIVIRECVQTARGKKKS